ncbi:2-phospho-L-lactate guanylyltransferase [Roseibium algae]|uniref:3-phospho-D-glycerate guanylyltransferase n=1 Tax=Roseibium algae TaxID=3123038 RepID=A0ABU8TF87_9HYPH
MTTWALIPVKRFVLAKTRLSGWLSETERAGLAKSMLRDTLTAVSQAQKLDGVALITSDPEASAIGTALGAVILEDTTEDLNSALTIGRIALQQRYASSACLVLPSDLPTLMTTDVEHILSTKTDDATVVVVPAHDQEGTNALLTTKDAELPFSFGPDSYRRHMNLAISMGLRPTTLNLPRVAIDFDKPGDLRLINLHAPGSHTAGLLSSLSHSEAPFFKEVS